MESIFQVISSSRDCEKISEAECSKGENLRGGVEEGSKRSVGCTSKTVSTEHESNQMGAMFFIFFNHFTSTHCISDSRTPPTTNNHPPHKKPILTPEIALRRSSLPAGLGRSLAPSPGARLASHSPRWRAHWQGEAG